MIALNVCSGELSEREHLLSPHDPFDPNPERVDNGHLSGSMRVRSGEFFFLTHDGTIGS